MSRSTLAPARMGSDLVAPRRQGVSTDVGCPDWCELPTDHHAGARHVAHRAAMWELLDRVELCVIQVISEDRADSGEENRLPMLYYWSSEHAVLTEGEFAELARAVRRAANLLGEIYGV
jgi:hypothetical protein